LNFNWNMSLLILKSLPFLPPKMNFRYPGVHIKSQKHDLQVDAFIKKVIKPKNIYADISSGAKAERKGLDL